MHCNLLFQTKVLVAFNDANARIVKFEEKKILTPDQQNENFLITFYHIHTQFSVIFMCGVAHESRHCM